MGLIVAADFGSDADTLAAASGIANKDVIFPGDSKQLLHIILFFPSRSHAI